MKSKIRSKISLFSILIFFFSSFYLSGCGDGGNSSTETANVTVTSNVNGTQVSILSYNKDGTKERDSVEGTASNNQFEKSVKMDKDGGYLIVNVTKDGYADWSKRVNFDKPHDMSINAVLSPVQSQSIIPLNDSTVTVLSTGQKVIKIALIKRSNGKKVIATGNQIRALNGIPEFSMEIPRNKIDPNVKALKVGLSSFDPDKDADKFPGDYIDENGNRLISLGFNYISITDENGNPVFRENNPSATETTVTRVTRWVNENACDNLPGDFCTGAAGEPEICSRLNSNELNGYNVPFYRYEPTTGAWELLGVGTFDINRDGNIDNNDAAGSNFDAIQTCHDNYGFNTIIVITNPNFRYCNLDYPVVTPPTELCFKKTFKDQNDQPFTNIYVWLEDNDNKQSFLYTSGNSPDETGTVILKTWNIASDSDTDAKLYYQYTRTIDNQTLIITKSEDVTLGTDPNNCPTKTNTIDLTEKLCQVKGTVKYFDDTPAEGIWVNITNYDSIDLFTFTNENGKFSAPAPCGEIIYVRVEGNENSGFGDDERDSAQLFYSARFKADGQVNYDEAKDEAQPADGSYRFIVTLYEVSVPKPNYSLYVYKEGNGKITSNPPGINCGSDCFESYEQGTSITLTAVPDMGNRINHWVGCDSISPDNTTCTVTMNDYKFVTVVFKSNIQYTLNVSVTGNGSVVSNPLGINNCEENNGTCSNSFFENTEVSLTANPGTGSIFKKWEGDCSSCGANLTCTITMDADKNCSAEFIQSNNPPVITSFTATPNSGNAPLYVTFNWNVSDPDGDTLTCYIDVNNDGNNDYTINDCASTTSQIHTYANAGNYTAKLIVTDNFLTVDKTTTINVSGTGTTIDIIGVWEGSYTGSDGSKGQICVEMFQNGTDVDGEVYVQGEGHIGLGIVSLNGNNIEIDVPAGTIYTGTVSNDGNSASGIYEDQVNNNNGTWQLTKTDKESCGWITSDSDILNAVGFGYFSDIITEISTIEVNNNGTSETNWRGTVIEFIDNINGTNVPYVVAERKDNTYLLKAPYSSGTTTVTLEDKTQGILYIGTNSTNPISNANYDSTVIYDSGCVSSRTSMIRAKLYKGTADITIPNTTLHQTTPPNTTRTIGIPSQNVTAYKVEVFTCP